MASIKQCSARVAALRRWTFCALLTPVAHTHTVMASSRSLVNHHATLDPPPSKVTLNYEWPSLETRHAGTQACPDWHTHTNTVMGTAIILRDTQDYWSANGVTPSISFHNHCTCNPFGLRVTPVWIFHITIIISTLNQCQIMILPQTNYIYKKLVYRIVYGIQWGQDGGSCLLALLSRLLILHLFYERRSTKDASIISH